MGGGLHPPSPPIMNEEPGPQQLSPPLRPTVVLYHSMLYLVLTPS